MTDSASLPLAPKATPELEKMLIEHERLCMEDLRKAFVAEDASRAIEPVTARILTSRKALLSMLDAGAESSRIPPTADFKELLDAMERTAFQWRAFPRSETKEAGYRASRKAVEDYVAVLRYELDEWKGARNALGDALDNARAELASLRDSQK